MARIETLASLYTGSGHQLPAVPPPAPVPPRIGADSSGQPYQAGGAGRRAQSWVTTRLGPTTVLWSSLEEVRARSRHEVRNNPWAAAGVDNFESQAIGNGIRPRWNITDRKLKREIETAFARWSKTCDASGRSDFYGLQAVVAREVYEAGEVFSRDHVRPKSWKLRIPYQIQLLESEQLPLWRNIAPSEAGVDKMPKENTIRTGIEFDPSGRRVAYHMYKEHPGETMFYPLEGLTFMRVPASEIRHVYKPLRAGLLRGVPMMAATLTLLYELEQYSDAELVRKKVAAMFAGFITKTSPDTDIIPIDTNSTPGTAARPGGADPGVANSKIESGTLQELLPGETITFPVLPADSSYEQFIRVSLHKFATGTGATYEQISGDLSGVSYSSIRSGLLNFRRACEQWQRNIIIFQFCQPIAERFLEEAVMAGELVLPGFTDTPELYTDIVWTKPGWDWVDPLKDSQAAILEIRGGLTTRTHEVAERGFDSADIDAEQAADAERSDALGLVYDSDPRKVLTGKQANPEPPDSGDPFQKG